MQNAGQDSQLKSGNLDRAESVYAYKIARVNPEYLSLKLWTFGGDVKSSRIACAKLGALLDEADSAIANGDFCLSLDGAQFALPEKLLREIRAQLSSYAVLSGGSGAQAVRGGVSMPSKPKAPARAARSAARKNLISPKDTRAAKDVELCDTAHTARASANFEAQVARIVGDELRKAIMPLLAEIDAIAALLKETAAETGAFKPVEMDASDMPISTRRGRTSVLVSRRKIS